MEQGLIWSHPHLTKVTAFAPVAGKETGPKQQMAGLQLRTLLGSAHWGGSMGSEMQLQEAGMNDILAQIEPPRV